MVELVGRADALRRLDQVLSGARRAEGGLLVVSGAPGTGRSAVLAHAKAQARGSGMAVQAVRAHPFDREAGLEVVRRLLAPIVDAHPGLVADGQAAWSRPLFEPVAGEVDHRAVSRGLTWLVERALERVGPLALVVDDLHRADVASIRVLAELAELAADLSLAIVVAHQPADAVAGSAHLVSLGEVVTLSELAEGDVAALVAARHGATASPEVVAAVRRATGGVPALVVPFLDAAEAEGAFAADDIVGALGELAPPRLPEQVRARLDDVGPAARALALAAAVLVDELRVDVLAAAAEVDVEAVGASMAELVDAGLFRPGPKPVWATPLLARAARSVLPEGARGQIATRAARAMHDAGDGASSVASLLVDAPPVAELWAAGTLAAAAQESEGRGAPEVARALWLRQMDEPLDHVGRGWAMASVARAEMHLGEPAGLARFRELAPMIDDPSLRAKVQYATGRASLWTGDPVGSAAAFDAAALDASTAGEPDQARRARAGRLMAVTIGSLGDDLVRDLAMADPDDEAAASPGASSMRCARAIAGVVTGSPAAEVRALAVAGVADDALYRVPFSDFTGLTSAAFALAASGAPGEGVAVIDRVVAVAREIGQLSSAATLGASRSPLLLAMGRVSEAIDSAEEALVDPHAWPIERPAAAAALVDARRLQGDLAAAAEVLAQHPVDLGPDRGPLRSAELQWALAAARLALETGDASHALWLADRALGCSAMARAFGADEVRALALAATGEVEQARTVSAEAVVRTAAAAPHRSAAALAIDGRLRGDLDAVEAAAELAASSSSPIGRGEVLIALGHERLRAGRRTPARDAFREALSSAEHAGAHGQAGRASDGLRLAGGRPRRTALVGVASLTPSEERICRLVAGGRSNREVAESLFLSRKTVEYHLGNAYGKLGIASRDALADVFESTEAP